MGKKEEVVFVGIGEGTDPFPHVPKTTKFWVFSKSCPACNNPGRLLEIQDRALVLRCPKCQGTVSTTLSAKDLPDVSYVFWCNSSVFPTDSEGLSPQSKREISRMVDEFSQGETPEVHWGVIVIGGRCTNLGDCQNDKCPYHVHPHPEMH